MTDIHTILKTYFGFSSFRPQQQEIIAATLQGRDVLALLPTGGGKSLCYQVPALAKEGLCLVISPLIALMKDQLDHLHKKNITAFALYSGQSFHEIRQTLKTAAQSNCKFLYVSPERLQTKIFKEWLPSLPVNLIAVDEAHCISQWGYDFRPPYLQIASIRELISDVPVLALTASATAEVQMDICEKLSFSKPLIFRQSFARPKLSFSTFCLSNKYNKLKEILQNVPGSALVYCKNRGRTKAIAQLLEADSIAATYYHAGLSTLVRTQRQKAWMNGTARIMVCTNAFGMGIDKPDVRAVVHMDVPECLENYYQEAGRAGRDGEKAYAALLYSQHDLQEMELLADQKFPPIGDIRKIYDAICNYVQVPISAGEEQLYDFDIHVFCHRWKLSSNLVINILKMLSQEGYITFHENIFMLSKVGFITDKAYLYEFEAAHPDLEPVIKCLLRTYDGIFTNVVSINEMHMAKLMKQSPEETVRQLQLLSNQRIIDYRPKKESPQIFFLYNRIAKEELIINQQLYQKRKKQYVYRMRSMLQYALNEKRCRSEIIRKYFGERNTESCGICDVCLHKKKSVSQTQEQQKIVREQLKFILQIPHKLSELQTRLPDIKKQSLAKAIDYLLSEEIIGYDLEGRLFLKR